MPDVITQSISSVLPPSRDLQSNGAYENFTVQNVMCPIGCLNEKIKERKKKICGLEVISKDFNTEVELNRWLKYKN